MSPGDLFIETIVEGLAGVLVGVLESVIGVFLESVFSPILEQLVRLLGIGSAAAGAA